MWWHLSVVLTISHVTSAQNINLLRECAKYYRPKNYLDLLPRLPYIDQLAMPNNIPRIRTKEYASQLHNIAPSPVMTTKVVEVKTKYVYPVCVKYTKKQKLCSPNIKENNKEKLVTKEHFVKNVVEKRVESLVDVMEPNSDRFNLKVSFDRLEPSEETEESRAFSYNTPSMSPKVQELLIEDRLDQLETILPDYQRRRTYETSTIYVTKTISNKRAMATLTVKNCIPMGFDVCAKRKSRRSSKVTRKTRDSDEDQYYFG